MRKRVRSSAPWLPVQAEMRRMELRLAQSEHYGRTVADARDAARNRVTTLEAEVAHYSGQAEEASEQLATTQEVRRGFCNHDNRSQLASGNAGHGASIACGALC